MIIAQFTTHAADKKKIDVSLASTHSVSEFGELKLTFSVSEDENDPVEIVISTSADSDNIAFSAFQIPHTSPFVSCLILCGLGHIAKEILDCIKKGHRKPKALLNCLKTKGVSLSLALAQCALKCGLSGGDVH